MKDFFPFFFLMDFDILKRYMNKNTHESLNL